LGPLIENREADLVQTRLANCLWKYRRVINAESAQIKNQLEATSDNLCLLSLLSADSVETEDPETDLDFSSPDADTISAHSIPKGSFRLNLMHYEMRLDKQLARAYRLLYHLQLIEEAKKLSTHPTQTKNS
jgi:hypothetical protein